ncbi:MAG: carboxynorspermidine decarboxylase [Desulfobulbaceae bacterium]|nr:carboxynorspermidine decarboxylase [Desulfobulbaceae bacterium]HIJ77940.1 carboxynorspermidine decarboxylase [Deltaproteobacteria bacterium]
MSHKVKNIDFDLSRVPTPSYVCDRQRLAENLAILDLVQRRTGCRILLALKGFAMFSLFGQIRQVLAGASASSLAEARLAAEEFGKEVHVYAPAYGDDEFGEILGCADHLVFNSFSQWRHFKERVQSAGKKISCGIRVNPQYSEVDVDLYNPCGRYSRLGVIRDQFKPEELDGIEGLHFHALCEQDSDALANTVAALEERFGEFLGRMKWLNFGGGHHITREGYDLNRLCALISRIQDKYGVQVYLEPGEAIALNIGVLVTRVMDIVHNEVDIAILDTSATAHMPDVLEMPYRPVLFGAGEPGEFQYTYKLGGLSCLAGDVIGDYSFPTPLQIGQRLVFGDMGHYTMVKTTTFNGVRLPSIVVCDSRDDSFAVVRSFGYEDYRNRLS